MPDLALAFLGRLDEGWTVVNHPGGRNQLLAAKAAERSLAVAAPTGSQ
jgi:hypothetical protein